MPLQDWDYFACFAGIGLTLFVSYKALSPPRCLGYEVLAWSVSLRWPLTDLSLLGCKDWKRANSVVGNYRDRKWGSVGGLERKLLGRPTCELLVFDVLRFQHLAERVAE